MPFARYFCIFINVGLGEGSALPVGVPVPWPLAVPPAGWLKCNGAAFTASQYPQLALAYPSLRLPDLRGSLSVAGMTGAGLTQGVRYCHFRRGLSFPALMTMIQGISVR